MPMPRIGWAPHSFEYQGYKCSGSVVLQVLLIAAAQVVSLFAACRSLADAPTDQTIRNALAATLPEMIELERRLNLALVTSHAQGIAAQSRMLAIDLTLIPYHGQPAYDAKEIFAASPNRAPRISMLTPRRWFCTRVTGIPWRCARRVRRIDEGGCPTLAGDCPSAGGENPFSPAGQGVFQRGSDSVSSPCPLRFHHSRGRAGPEAQGSQSAFARPAALLKRKNGYYRETLTAPKTKEKKKTARRS